MPYTQNENAGGLETLTTLATGDLLLAGDVDDSNRLKAITKANLLTDFADETQTLTNKTIDGDNNTISNLVIGAEVSTTATADINLGGNNIDAGGVIFLQEQADADADVAGSGQIWVNTATPNELYFTDDAGTDHQVVVPTNTVTLTNKTIDGDNNTLSNLDLGNEVDWAAADDVTTRSAFASGDKVLIFEAGVGMRKVDYDDLPGAGGGLSNVVEDTTPQLGGDLDAQDNNLNSVGPIFMNERAAAEADVVGDGQLWVKNDTPNTLQFTDDAGTDFQIATLTGTETFTNKTLTSPTLTTPVLGTPSSGNLGSCTAYPGDSSLTTVGTVITGNVDAVVSAASTTTAGKIEVATSAETDTGTDAARAVSPDGLAGSNFGIRYVSILCFDYGTDTATGDGKGYFHIPSGLDGMNLISVHAEVFTAGTTGTTDVQIHNVDNALDMLSTKLTIDSAETGSDTAATAAVINTSNDHVNTNDVIRIDVDAVSTTAAKGLLVTMGFQLP